MRENENVNENENNAAPDWTVLISSMMTIRTDRRADCAAVPAQGKGRQTERERQIERESGIADKAIKCVGPGPVEERMRQTNSVIERGRRKGGIEDTPAIHNWR